MPDVEEDVGTARARLVDEFGRLVRAEACLSLRDGTRWLVSSTLFTDEWLAAGPPYDRFVLWLFSLLVERKTLRCNQRAGLSQVVLRQDTLDYRRVSVPTAANGATFRLMPRRAGLSACAN
jgi:hypothetical protein